MEKKFTFSKAILLIIFLVSAVLCNILPEGYSLLLFAVSFLSFVGFAYFSKLPALLITLVISYTAILGTIYFTNPGTEMFYEAFRQLLFICPTAVFLGYAFKKKFDFKTTYAYGVLIFVLCIMAHMLKIVWIDKVNIMESYIRLPLYMLLNASYSLGEVPFSNSGDMATEDVIKAFTESIAYSSPAFIIAFAMICVFILFILSKKVIRIFNKEENFPNIVPFSHIKLKRTTSLALCLMYLLSLFSSGTFGIIIGNIVSVLSVMCIGCGLSVIDFYFKKAIRNSFIRAFIYITGFIIISIIMSLLVFINPLIILLFIGLIDATRDFRKIDTFKIKFYFK